MPLEEEIASASKKVIKDGYDMSIGELMSLYRDRELFINPKYQRYFRWDDSQKTKFIESLLLGIPIPPIFVYTTGRKWELVDGLQRMSTILEFVGLLRDPEDPDQQRLLPPSVLEGTNLLPSLANARWDPTDEDSNDGLSDELKFALKRVRIRVEILKKESDPQAKYELFQRLNTGGSPLSEQEIRSCVIVMINETFYDWLCALEKFEPFQRCIDQTDRAEKRQKPMELVIRFLSFRNHPYQSGIDVHDYLDSSVVEMASKPNFGTQAEERIFKNTFTLLNESLGSNAFKKWDDKRFAGQTSLSAYEFISYGISLHVAEILKKIKPNDRKSWIEEKVKKVWHTSVFRENSKAGVRGTTRLSNLLPVAKTFFQP
jgi:uncharacterized protein with ParB-like and HNH nuclease domain